MLRAGRAVVTLGLVAFLASCAHADPLRKQRQVVDVSGVSDPVLAARIAEASDRILRFLGLLMEATDAEGRSPYVRPMLKTPDTTVRVPPRKVGGTRSDFGHMRLYDWKWVEPNALEFRVLYVDVTGKKHYTDDFRFIKFNGAWYFAGHPSAEPTPMDMAPLPFPADPR
jgi:hypothetical protein